MSKYSLIVGNFALIIIFITAYYFLAQMKHDNSLAQLEGNLTKYLQQNDILQAGEFLKLATLNGVVSCAEIAEISGTTIYKGADDCPRKFSFTSQILGWRTFILPRIGDLEIFGTVQVERAVTISFIIVLLCISSVFSYFVVIRKNEKNREQQLIVHTVFDSVESMLVSNQTSAPVWLTKEFPEIENDWQKITGQWKQISNEMKYFQNFKNNNELSKQLAHDLRTPLAALKTAVSLRVEDHINLVNGAIKRLEQIIADVLTPQTRNDMSSIYDAVHDTIGEMKLETQKMHPQVNIVINGNDDLSKHYLVPPSPIYRIVSNLMKNANEAICASGVGGTIRIQLFADSTIPLRISDDGPGLPEVVKSTLFHKPVTVGKKNGNGLGLLIVRQLAEELGWKTECKSEHGKTVFSFFDNNLKT